MQQKRQRKRSIIHIIFLNFSVADRTLGLNADEPNKGEDLENDQMLDTDPRLKMQRVYSRKGRNLAVSDMAWEDAAFWGHMLQFSE